MNRKKSHTKMSQKMSFSCKETPVINSGKADVLGRACGFFFLVAGSSVMML